MGNPTNLSVHSQRKGPVSGFDRSIADLAGRQHGVVTRRQLATLGLQPSAIEYRIAIGRLHTVHRGVYNVGHRVITRDAAWMAAALVAEGAVLSHRAAAALWGIRATDRRAIEITVPRRVKPRASLEVHEAPLPADEVTTHRRIPVTTPARTLFDLAAVISVQELERAATEAEIQRLGSRTSLADLVARYPRRKGNAAIRELLAARNIGRNVTKRELELRFLTFLDAQDLPRPRINAKVDLPPRDPEVDCLWEGARLVVELDGFAVHGTRPAFEADRARDRELQVAGYRVVRITWRQLTDDAPLLARQLRSLLTPSPA